MSELTPQEALLADVEEAMRDVVDPELGINVVDLGLVYGIAVDDDQLRRIPERGVDDRVLDARLDGARPVDPVLAVVVDALSAPVGARGVPSWRARSISDGEGRNMGIFDKIKDVASDVAEKGQDLAKEQQLKLELRKLETGVEEAYAAYGKRAYELQEAGTLAAGELAAEAAKVKEAIASRDAKKAELDAEG